MNAHPTDLLAVIHRHELEDSLNVSLERRKAARARNMARSLRSAETRRRAAMAGLNDFRNSPGEVGPSPAGGEARPVTSTKGL